MAVILFVWSFLLATVMVSLLQVCDGQGTVTVTVQPATSADQGSTATIPCSYTLSDSSYSLFLVQWHKGPVIDRLNSDTILAAYINGQPAPIYPGGGSKYSMSTDSIATSTVLSVSSVQFASDEGRYWCLAEFRKTGEAALLGQASTELTVIVLPTSISLSEPTMSFPNTGGTVYAVAGQNLPFTCSVPGINPGATFTWTVGSQPVAPVSATINIIGSDQLITSTSVATLEPAWNQHGETLTCQASNKQGDSGLTTSVTLDVKVPPSVVTLSDQTGNLNNGRLVVVNIGTSHMFTCTVQATRPQATITWYLNDMLHETVPAPSEIGDTLEDTTDDWTLTPTRSNHGQGVRCEGSTADGSLSSSVVTLDVNGPPDSPTITDSSSLVEDVNTTLTCQADQGYPNDWQLVWYSGNAPIVGPTTSAQVLTGNRYRFTSMYTLTPTREDNGIIVSCTAQRTGFPNTLAGSLQLDVKFCALSVTVSSCPDDPLIADGVQTYTFSCTSGSSNPRTTLTWTGPTGQDDLQPYYQPGDNGGDETVLSYNTGVLSKRQDGEVFTCTATNTLCPGGVTDSCTLNVHYAPEFLQRPEINPSTPINEGAIIVFECTVDANPKDSDIITWVKQDTGEELTSTTYSDGSSQLFLLGATREQAGPYRCRANNGVPTADIDVSSEPVVVIVHYAANITNKDDRQVSKRDKDVAALACIAKANPTPTIQWFDPGVTEITNSVRPTKYVVVDTITSGDDTYGFIVTSVLTVMGVMSLDFGEYTCRSSNGVGDEDSHRINLHAPRRPDRPTNVVITDRTWFSLTATWTPGYDGGDNQWFVAGYRRTSDPPGSETLNDLILGDVSFTVTGLDSYTQYVVLVYAQNTLGRNPDYSNTFQYTLPPSPDINSKYEIQFNMDEGTVTVRGLTGANGCIQLEVRYTAKSEDWAVCGDCIQVDSRVTLSQHCGQRRRRRRRQTPDDIEDVRASVCYLETNDCSAPSVVEKVTASTTSPVPTSNGAVIVSIILGIVLLIGVIVISGYFLKRKQNQNPTKDDSNHRTKATRPLPSTNDTSPTPFYHQNIIEMDNVPLRVQHQVVYKNSPNEHKAFPRSQLVIMNELGKGAFGLVLLANADGILERSKFTLVAVKTIKEGAGTSAKEDILNELDLQKKLPNHRNIVSLLGFCVEKDPPYIIMEYLSRGNLKDFLKNSRIKSGNANATLTPGDLMTFAKDVADGMAFLSDNQCIHRDMAARNVLVAEDRTCKIADFGLARDVINTRVYERTSEGRLPLRWMALESILDDVYTTESDVWSYGVLLWEIVTLGARPYPALSSKVMIEDLQSGYRMPMPPNCKQEVYKIMLSCWKKEPMDRPTFQTISKEIAKLISARGKEFISLKAFEESVYEEIQPSDIHEKV